ncbi:MAG: glycosyltransferase, partial [Chitinophagia bacterium]|nr:glycosyltransferase [Chitinophagia bacterium]
MWAFVGWAVIQVVYAVFIFLRFFRLPATNACIDEIKMQGVSIVICAKNEADNLRKHLPRILTQNYSNNNVLLYEVIVVNDCSDDATHEVLAALKKQYPHLHEIVITPDTQRTVVGKKFALSTGVT